MDQGHSSDSSRSPSPPPKQKAKPKIKGIDENVQVQAETEDDIWPDDVEMYFQEALKIYPPIGRRKLLENGKMYGRNELIAKYIYLKTGKMRTRKQVSSHIQVLGKKSKKLQEGSLPPSTKITTTSPTLPKETTPEDPPPPKLTSSSSASMPANSSHLQMHPQMLNRAPAPYHPVPSYVSPQPNNFAPFVPKPMIQSFPATSSSHGGQVLSEPFPFRPTINTQHDEYSLRPLMTYPQYTEVPNTPDQDSFPACLRDLFVFLRFFSASLEPANGTLSGLVSRHHFVSLQSADFSHIYGDIPIDKVERNFFGLRELFDRSSSPCFFFVKCMANVGTPGYGLHALHVKYQSRRRMTLKCSTTVYSFGQAVVEKIQVEDPTIEQNYYSYYFNHSPMCDYMVQFIETLKSLNDISKMNRVLSNFSVLQVIIDTESNVTLMSTALTFEISGDSTIRNEVYRLVPSK